VIMLRRIVIVRRRGRPRKSSVLHSVNVAISLLQALTSAEAVSRAIPHA
jgi:hypothetical protein